DGAPRLQELEIHGLLSHDHARIVEEHDARQRRPAVDGDGVSLAALEARDDTVRRSEIDPDAGRHDVWFPLLFERCTASTSPVRTTFSPRVTGARTTRPTLPSAASGSSIVPTTRCSRPSTRPPR